MTRPDRTPVLVGIGVAEQREDDWRRALEPMDLMLAAVRAAGADTGSADALAGAQFIAVPRGRWTYANPAGEIRRVVGARDAVTALASVGVLQQTLLGDACERIARGEAHTTLVAGADAGYRILRAQIAGERATERTHDDAPDVFMQPKDELRHPVELRAGFRMPVGLYAIMESAFRAHHGWSVAEHRDRLARMGEQSSRVAAQNPHAWHQRLVNAATIREGTERNPMQAFPYTRYHCSTWNVDQASALLFCSEARATALGIDRARWIYPLASTESNHMVPVSARAVLHECVGARVAGRAALDACGLTASDIDLVDFYSCFPIAVQAYAEATGMGLDRDLTVTGGMPFAGGPYNNYHLQAVCRAVELLREGRGRNALVSGVSGTLTKQGFGIWAREPRGTGFTRLDVTAEVAASLLTREVVNAWQGPATVAGFTVLYGRGQVPRGAALVDTPDGRRAMATSEDPALIARMQEEEFVGCVVQVDGHALHL